MDKVKEYGQRILCAFVIILAGIFTILAVLIGIIGIVLFNRASDLFVYYSSIDDDKEWDEMIDVIADILDSLRKAVLYAKIEL